MVWDMFVHLQSSISRKGPMPFLRDRMQTKQAISSKIYGMTTSRRRMARCWRLIMDSSIVTPITRDRAPPMSIIPAAADSTLHLHFQFSRLPHWLETRMPLAQIDQIDG